jgi:hypothetical protein
MKKILVIGNPFLPCINGSNKVIYEYCQLLIDLGYDVSYCTTNSNEQLDDFFNGKVYVFKSSFLDKFSLRKWWNRIKYFFLRKYDVDYYYLWGLERFVDKLQVKFHFDACIINYINLSRLFENCSIPQKVVYTHDAFTYKKEILGIDHFWFDLLPNQEAKAIRRCTDVISIQKNESILFHYYHPYGNIYTVYSQFKVNIPTLTFKRNILFIASGNAINYNGIRYFLDNVFNVLTERYCDVNLIIAGTICEKLSNEHSKQIQLIGKIEDLSDFYKLGDIVINPIYQGTGLKVKTFEALSYGKIVVAHRHSTEGVYEEITAPIMIADSPSSYLSHLIKLLDSPENWQQYSDNSIDYINRLNKYVKDQYKNIFSK